MNVRAPRGPRRQTSQEDTGPILRFQAWNNRLYVCFWCGVMWALAYAIDADLAESILPVSLHTFPPLSVATALPRVTGMAVERPGRTQCVALTFECGKRPATLCAC
jgi:hypothetical protein